MKFELTGVARRSILGVAVSLLGVSASFADLFYLTEDRLIEGILVREDAGTVTFKLDGAGLWTLSRSSLHKIEKESPGEYWLRQGDRQARRNELVEAQESFEKARQIPSAQRQAERRLKDLDGLSRQTSNPAAIKTSIAALQPRHESKEKPSLPEISAEPTQPAEPKVAKAKVPPAPTKAAPKVAKAERKRVDTPKPTKVKAAPRKKNTKEHALAEVVRTEARKNGIDPLLVRAVITVESSWNARATSPSGARGLMQLMPKTAAQLGVRDSYNPTQNIRGGAKYLGLMMKEFSHLEWPERTMHAIAAYNAGPNKVRSTDYRKIPSARRYTQKVMAAYEKLKQEKNSEVALLGRRASF